MSQSGSMASLHSGQQKGSPLQSLGSSSPSSAAAASPVAYPPLALDHFRATPATSDDSSRFSSGTVATTHDPNRNLDDTTNQSLLHTPHISNGVSTGTGYRAPTTPKQQQQRGSEAQSRRVGGGGAVTPVREENAPRDDGPSIRRPISTASTGRLPRRSATHLLLYTRAVPLPKRFETVTEYRFLMRMTQLFMAGAAFASLATASFNVNYTSAVLAKSGINLMSFVSISSLFVSFGCILVYCFPAFTGVPPHRHPRFSRVEVGLDLVYLGFWIAASTVLVRYGNCPRLTFSTAPGDVSCLPWNMCTAFGYAAAALFLGTFVMGVRDLLRYGLWKTGRGNGVMWARGSWKEWAES
ncbi:hypothetical protein HDU86_001725 [Geranomyces michiganensis]|nr:hypothetical protein HDU86_001725 [Geranomyces michiganensis]